MFKYIMKVVIKYINKGIDNSIGEISVGKSIVVSDLHEGLDNYELYFKSEDIEGYSYVQIYLPDQSIKLSGPFELYDSDIEKYSHKIYIESKAINPLLFRTLTPTYIFALSKKYHSSKYIVFFDQFGVISFVKSLNAILKLKKSILRAK